jgi:organic radical activating enzyme
MPCFCSTFAALKSKKPSFRDGFCLKITIERNLNSITEIAVQTTYPLMEAFYTLQGEGSHTGKAAYFIRLGGCDVGCVWCDVKDSWDAGKHPVKTIDQIIATIKKDIPNNQQSPLPIIVITGGEPLMHDLTALTQSLHDAGFTIII